MLRTIDITAYILYISSSGYVKSGLVCALLAEFERIRIEEEANILETVKRIKERNPRMVQHYVRITYTLGAPSFYIYSMSLVCRHISSPVRKYRELLLSP